MKKIFFVISIIFLSFMMFNCASACVNVTLSKSSYFPGETFQAEITGNFSQGLAYSNILFSRQEKEVPLYFSLIQISSDRYFVSFTLPINNSVGDWSLDLRNVLCIENETLKVSSSKTNFSIQSSTTDFFNLLVSKANSGWALSAEENAMELMALSYNSQLSSNGKKELYLKSNSGECWPSGTCDVKSTAMALLAMKNILNETEKQKIINWLLDSQNSLAQGLWDVVANSTSSGTCKLGINGNYYDVIISSGQSIESIGSKISYPEVNISLNCSIDLQSAKVVHTYLGKITEFPMQKEIAGGNYLFKTALNNKKCWGINSRSSCNATSTAYAILALKNSSSEADIASATAWLNQNAQTTQEKSLAFLFSKDSSLQSWLLNNQAQLGFWSKGAIALDSQPDVLSTIIAEYSLENSGAFDKNSTVILKSKRWLYDQCKSNASISVMNLASLLSFVFPVSQTEAIMSVDEGIVKTISNRVFSVTARNKGILPLNAVFSIDDLGLSQNISLNAGDFKSVNFAIPAMSSNTIVNLAIDYGTNYGGVSRYNIPVIIFASGAADQLMQPGIFSLLPTSLVFLEGSINSSYPDDKNYLLEVHMKNFGKYALTDVRLEPSIELSNIINVSNSSTISLQPGETKSIILNVLSYNEIATEYNGFLQAKTNGLTFSLPISIKITSNVSYQTNGTCAQLNGSVCNKTQQCDINNTVTSDLLPCCLGNCKEIKASSGLKIWGFVMILVAIFVVILFLRRKPKKPAYELKEVVEKIEEKYKK
jgi:hypothetical protein